MSRLTLKAVNAELERLGVDERLEKGHDYYYFTEGEASSWSSTMVYVYRLNQLTLEQWIGEYHHLKENA